MNAVTTVIYTCGAMVLGTLAVTGYLLRNGNDPQAAVTLLLGFVMSAMTAIIGFALKEIESVKDDVIIVRHDVSDVQQNVAVVKHDVEEVKESTNGMSHRLENAARQQGRQDEREQQRGRDR